MQRALILSIVILTSILCLASEQEQTQKIRGNIVTTEVPLRFALWKYNQEIKGFQRTWTSLPILDDEEYYTNYQTPEHLFSYLSGILSVPIITDLDGDDENELIVLDGFGIIVYGKSSTYFPFPTASRFSDNHILVEDINEDGQKNIITLRHPYPDSLLKGELAIWQIRNNRLEKLWEKTDTFLSFVLAYGDADNDEKKELIVAGNRTIYLLKRVQGNSWEIVEEIPNLGVVDVVRIADVDGDNKNEILATGSAGKLTIYKQMKNMLGENIFPVIWQSEELINKDVKPTEFREPKSFTQGLEVSDLDGDGKNEILVGTGELGILPHEDENKEGHIYVFKHSGKNSFKDIWKSDWTYNARIPAFTVGDIDSDKKNEIIYNGMEAYEYTGPESMYEKIGSLSTNAHNAVIGELPNLVDPITSLRIIPIRWDLRTQDLKPGQTYKSSLSIRNVWAEAKNVSMNLKTDSDYITIENGHQKLGLIKSGEIIDSQPISVQIANIKPLDEEDYIRLVFWIEITADGGYKQSIPIILYIKLTE